MYNSIRLSSRPDRSSMVINGHQSNLSASHLHRGTRRARVHLDLSFSSGPYHPRARLHAVASAFMILNPPRQEVLRSPRSTLDLRKVGKMIIETLTLRPSEAEWSHLAARTHHSSANRAVDVFLHRCPLGNIWFNAGSSRFPLPNTTLSG